MDESQKMLRNKLEGWQRELERLIMITPTSESRNIMCDVNIQLMDAIYRLTNIKEL